MIYALRLQFARHGIPLEVISDNSPFGAAEFKKFAERREFKHTTSSPRYPQSNGKVENAVKTAKRLMTKAVESGGDPLLGLLDWRNTPSEQLSASPAQLMFGRRTRTRLPTSNALLMTPTTAAAQKSLTAAKQLQAQYYNRGAKERYPLPVGQTVCVRYDDKDWRKAQIGHVLPHRSYDVKFDDGTTRRRTSRHVRFSSDPPIIVHSDVDEPALSPPASVNVPQTSDHRDHRPRHDQSMQKTITTTSSAKADKPQTVTVTRSGRVVKTPSRYLD